MKLNLQGRLTEGNIPCLHKKWYTEYMDMMSGVWEQLPLFCEVNHEINLIDKNKQYNYHLPHCPHHLCDKWHEKLNHYVNAGWWKPCSVSQAAPILCIHK